MTPTADMSSTRTSRRQERHRRSLLFFGGDDSYRAGSQFDRAAGHDSVISRRSCDGG
jgi:hypothetical protein